MSLLSPLRALKRWTQARWEASRAFVGGNVPVLVYQMGKVGSSTVYAAIKADMPRTPAYHVHFLSQHLAEHRRSHLQGLPVVPYHIYLGEALREQLLDHPGRAVKVISLVRDPVAFELSNLFQNPRLIGGNAELGRLVAERESMCAALQQRLGSDDGQAYVEGWFDREIRSVFDIDVFAEPFDCERGWQRYRSDNVELLVIRLEDLSACGGRVIAEFLGAPSPLHLARANDRTSQAFGTVYRKFADSLKLDPALLQAVYRRRFARHFYTDAERERMFANWEDIGAPGS